MDENKIQNNKISGDLKSIHTYTSDMADAVRENEASVIKIALAEKEKREKEAMYREASGTNTTKTLLVVGGIVLIACTIVGSYFLFKKSQSDITTQKLPTEVNSVITYDEKVFIDTTDLKTPSDLADKVQQELKNQSAPESIKAIFLTRDNNGVKELLPVSKLISLMDIGAPSTLKRTISSDYMIGTFTDKINVNNTDPSVRPHQHLFLVFEVNDYNQAYASMLDWEKVMLHDMFMMFNINVAGDKSSLLEKDWKDVLIDNKDARILYDNDGSDILYYIFLNKGTLVITNSKETIEEIDQRLLAKMTKPL